MKRVVRVVGVLVTTAITATGITACGVSSGRAEFRDRSFTDVREALADDGVLVCHAHHDEDGFANQATATEELSLSLALDCDADERVELLVDRYDTAEHRDGAARQFESQVRPRGDGAVWTWGPFTLFATGARDDHVMDRVTDALDAAGAR